MLLLVRFRDGGLSLYLGRVYSVVLLKHCQDHLTLGLLLGEPLVNLALEPSGEPFGLLAPDFCYDRFLWRGGCGLF